MENKQNNPKQTKITPRDKYNQVVDEFIIKLEANDIIPWTKSWSMTSKLPKNFETNNHYQGMNILTLLNRSFRDSRWLTFNQVKKLGGKVKKGETSSPIFFMKPVEKKEVNQSTGEEEIIKYFLMQSYNVFNIQQTEGIAYEEEVKAAKDENKSIQEFIASIGIEEYRGEPAYSPKDDCIWNLTQEEFENSDEYYSTYFHELTHATGHKSRLDRFEKHTVYGDENYAFEELIAEMGSVFLSVEHGIQPNSKKHAAYLDHWIKALKERPQILYSAASHASRSTNLLMDIHAVKKKLQSNSKSAMLPIHVNLTKQPLPKKQGNTAKKTFSPKAS